MDGRSSADDCDFLPEFDTCICCVTGQMSLHGFVLIRARQPPILSLPKQERHARPEPIAIGLDDLGDPTNLGGARTKERACELSGHWSANIGQLAFYVRGDRGSQERNREVGNRCDGPRARCPDTGLYDSEVGTPIVGVGNGETRRKSEMSGDRRGAEIGGGEERVGEMGGGGGTSVRGH